MDLYYLSYSYILTIISHLFALYISILIPLYIHSLTISILLMSYTQVIIIIEIYTDAIIISFLYCIHIYYYNTLYYLPIHLLSPPAYIYSLSISITIYKENKISSLNNYI